MKTLEKLERCREIKIPEMTSSEFNPGMPESFLKHVAGPVRLKNLLILAAVLAFTSAAGTIRADGDPPAINDKSRTLTDKFSTLTGTSWELRSFGEGDTAVSVIKGSTVSIRFMPENGEGRGRLTGSAGCNNFFTTYHIDGEKIEVGPPGATMMYCGHIGGLMDQEQRFLKALEKSGEYRITGKQLLIRPRNAGDSLVFEAETGTSTEPGRR